MNSLWNCFRSKRYNKRPASARAVLGVLTGAGYKILSGVTLTPHIFYGAAVDQIIDRRNPGKDNEADSHPSKLAAGDPSVVTKDKKPVKKIHGDHPD